MGRRNEDGAPNVVAVLEDDGLIRIGLATEGEEISEAIEAGANEAGGSLTEFVADAMGAEDELEHEVQHFHDDVFYCCSDIPYQREEDLSSNILRDEIIYYLDGYFTALSGFLDEKE